PTSISIAVVFPRITFTWIALGGHAMKQLSPTVIGQVVLYRSPRGGVLHSCLALSGVPHALGDDLTVDANGFFPSCRIVSPLREGAVRICFRQYAPCGSIGPL